MLNLVELCFEALQRVRVDNHSCKTQVAEHCICDCPVVAFFNLLYLQFRSFQLHVQVLDLY